ncbi:MAG: MBL fold metallo-hydrolase [Deltaproteobacteria bacterium]|nr:MBL fold metallo-hydrolase [Deltaproteobacteria bacterium]
MKLKFWGVRGAIACPGRDTVEFGGNTACLEILVEEANRLIIIDAGSGIRLLGNDIIKQRKTPPLLKADIFITHTHWDHIMGFPFFEPLYRQGTSLNIYGPVTYEEEPLEQIIGDQLRYRYFPISHSGLAASLHYHQIGEGDIDLGDGIALKTKYMNHTLLCLGYRFEYHGKSICTAFDTEPFRNLFLSDPDSSDYDRELHEKGEIVVKEENQRNVDFFRDTDILIHDAQYTFDEYRESKTGWGHSNYEHAIETAQQAHAKKLFLFHHDPYRKDAELRAIESKLQKDMDPSSKLEIAMAREGFEITL